LPCLLRDFGSCERNSADLIAYCVEKKFEALRGLAVPWHACARAMRELTEDSIAALRAAIDATRRSGAKLSLSSYLSCLAEASLAANDVTGAEAALQEAFAFVLQSGERYCLAELHRLDGRIALMRSAPDRTRAEAGFLEAIEVARAQEARMHELRAATDLALLWLDTRSPNDPRALLEPILAAITGGENTPDVRNARALLAEVV
jgi:predicted ATPase